MSTYQLCNGETLAAMAQLPDGAVDMILCDLPYGTTQNKWDSVIPFEPLWEQYKRLCKGAIVLFGGQPFTSELVHSNLAGFKYSWVWEKTTKTNFLNAKKQPLRKHEDILVFGTSPYYPQGLTKKRTFTKQGKTETLNYGAQDRQAGGYMQEDTGYPHDILQFTSETKKIHPTQKPVALMEYLIRTYTNENETVLDNTMGSGTTGVACMNTKRNFLGIELDVGYFEIAEKRICEAQAAKAVNPFL